MEETKSLNDLVKEESKILLPRKKKIGQASLCCRTATENGKIAMMGRCEQEKYGAAKENEHDPVGAPVGDEGVVFWPGFFGVPVRPESAITPDIGEEPSGLHSPPKR